MGVLAPNRMGGIKEEGEGKENEDGEERERESYSMAAAIFCKWSWPRQQNEKGVKRNLVHFAAKTLNYEC